MSSRKTDENIGTIYKIVNKINNKVYIGQTTLNVKDRWDRHRSLGVKNKAEQNMPIKRAFKKYGVENFEFSVIEKIPKESLNEREIYWIEYYDSYKNGYNACRGGQLGTKPLKIKESEFENIINLYKSNYTLKEIGNQYNVDKGTIKHILDINNVPIRIHTGFKFSEETKIEIISKVKSGISRKEIMSKYNISKGYLSQILSSKIEYNLSTSVQALTDNAEG